MLPKSLNSELHEDSDPLIEAMFNFQLVHIEAYSARRHGTPERGRLQASTWLDRGLDRLPQRNPLRRHCNKFIEAVNMFVYRTNATALEGLLEDGELLYSRSKEVEEGRHLENLSWRLWNRKTFCCAPGEANATTPAISMSQRSSQGRYSVDIPDLAGSINSIDEEAIESDNEESESTSAPLTITRPRVRRQDSDCNRSRGKERHITPDDLERMVIAIKEEKDQHRFSHRIRTQARKASAASSSPHRSSLSDALRRPEQKEQTSFREEVATRTIEEMSDDVFETDDDIDESAIDDDESSDWEDSMEESGKSSFDDKLSFPRSDRTAALQSAASKSTPALQPSRTSSPQGPSDAPESDDSPPLTMISLMRPGQEIPHTGAKPIIMTTTNVTAHQPALSPKTTRRQMLANELTTSLRRHLLWELK
ncbi:hypothetical protein V490_01583 [Pseudogymnoascus sp. VKM F-3557]|nr:hypothetical protein V490_01583 [Pseudogymnoascus sp. VKM F-3557]